MSKFKIGDMVVFSEKMYGENHNPEVKFDRNIRKIVNAQFGIYTLEGIEENSFVERELELAPITRNDLKFGDILTLRNGDRYVVADGYMYGEDYCYDLDSDKIDLWYNDDLTERENDKEQDIVKVERLDNVIYERKEEAKEMTVEEISKALGYEVKVVKESK